MAEIGFLGLGRMGRLMAHRLVAAGHHVAVWNRTGGKDAELVTAGAQAARTPAEAATARDFVITVLSDPQAVEEVLFGAQGAAARLGPALLVEMSTIGPDAVRAVRAALPAAARLVDAPVVGSLPQAEAGQLKILAGGADADIEDCRAVLEVLGTLTQVGPLGSGAALKLVLNTVLIASFGVIGESLTLADRLGLDEAATLDALGGTVLGSLVTRLRERIADPAAPTRFALGLAEKDLRLALDAGADPDGLVAAVHARLATAVRDARLGERDLSALISFLRRRQLP